MSRPELPNCDPSAATSFTIATCADVSLGSHRLAQARKFILRLLRVKRNRKNKLENSPRSADK
jgi:hypothetical protein